MEIEDSPQLDSKQPSPKPQQKIVGLENYSQISKLSADMKKIRNFSDKILALDQINQTKQPLLQQICGTQILYFTYEWLREAFYKPQQNEQLIDKIFSFYKFIEFDNKILEDVKIAVIIRDYKDMEDLDENLKKKAFQIYVKYKEMFDKWLSKYDENKNRRNKDKDNSSSKKKYNDSPVDFKKGQKSLFQLRAEKLHDIKVEERRHLNNKSFKRSRRYSRSKSRSRDKKRSKDGHSKTLSQDKHSSSRDKHYKDKYKNKDSKKEKEKEKEKIIIKNLRWMPNNTLNQVKHFKFDDEPTSSNLTQEELNEYQQKLSQKLQFQQDIRKSFDQDIKNEASHLKQLKEQERHIVEKLNAMEHKIQWIRPKKLNANVENMLTENISQDSQEKETHDKRIQLKISVYYPNIDSVPENPINNLINDSKSDKVYKNIQLDAPDQEDLKKVVEFQLKKEEEKKEKDKRNSHLKEKYKNLKSILKKSKEQLEKERLDEIAKIEKNKRDEEMIHQIVGLLQEPNKTEEINNQIKTLIHEINDPTKIQTIVKNIELIKKLQNNQPHRGKKSKDHFSLQSCTPQFQQLPNTFNTPQQVHQNTQIQNLIQLNKLQQQNPQIQQQPQQISQNSNNNPPIVPVPFQHPNSSQNFYNNQNPQEQNLQSAQQNLLQIQQQQQIFNQKQQSQFVIQQQMNSKYKTVPCRNYHSPVGCTYPDTKCKYIHNHQFQGTPVPGFRPQKKIQFYPNNMMQHPMQFLQQQDQEDMELPDQPILNQQNDQINNHHINHYNHQQPQSHQQLQNTYQIQPSLQNDPESRHYNQINSHQNQQKFQELQQKLLAQSLQYKGADNIEPLSDEN